jgi:hypothetical protein
LPLETARVGASCLLISSYQSLIEAGKALDVIGSWRVELFHHTNTSGFLQETLEKQKIYIIHLYISPKSSSSTNEKKRNTLNQKETKKRY